MSNDVVISVEGLSKSYLVGHEGPRGMGTTNITMKHLNQQTLLRNSRRGKTSVLKVIGFAMLGVAVVGVLGRMLK